MTFEEYFEEDLPDISHLCGPLPDLTSLLNDSPTVDEMCAIIFQATVSSAEPIALPADSGVPFSADWDLVRRILAKAIADKDLRAIYVAKVAADVLLTLQRLEQR